jgi:hypothetical protein
VGTGKAEKLGFVARAALDSLRNAPPAAGRPVLSRDELRSEGKNAGA